MSISGVGGMTPYDSWRLASPDDSPRMVDAQREADAAVDRASSINADIGVVAKRTFEGVRVSQEKEYAHECEDGNGNYETCVLIPALYLVSRDNGDLGFVLRSFADAIDGRHTA